MADLTPEVIDALVRLMKGEIDYSDMSDEQLVDLIRASRRGRVTLYEATLALRDRPGWTQARIGEAVGVTESAVSRWVDAPPNPPGRRRREDASE